MPEIRTGQFRTSRSHFNDSTGFAAFFYFKPVFRITPKLRSVKRCFQTGFKLRFGKNLFLQIGGRFFVFAAVYRNKILYGTSPYRLRAFGFSARSGMECRNYRLSLIYKHVRACAVNSGGNLFEIRFITYSVKRLCLFGSKICLIFGAVVGNIRSHQLRIGRKALFFTLSDGVGTRRHRLGF